MANFNPSGLFQNFPNYSDDPFRTNSLPSIKTFQNLSFLPPAEYHIRLTISDPAPDLNPTCSSSGKLEENSKYRPRKGESAEGPCLISLAYRQTCYHYYCFSYDLD
jgi:hypothetical protein